jgi:DNA-binding transcriptional ArsR family regulator
MSHSPDPPIGIADLARAHAHPTRLAVVRAFFEDPQAVHTPSQIARRLGLSLGVLSYHVRVLVELGALELRAESTVRGAVAHHYALDEDWIVPIGRLLDAAGEALG